MASRFAALSLPVALALLSACQLAPGSTPPFLTPTFRMQAVGRDAAAPAQAAVAPTEGATSARAAQPLDGPLAPTEGGQLTVRFGHLLGKAERRLLATIADVDKVTITLSGNGVSRTETILKAAITGGQTSFTFTGLPTGTLTVTIQALDVGGAVIGQDVQQATVTTGQTTVVASTVQLDPPSPSPRPLVVSGGGSGGSGGGASTGGLTTNVTLVDGAPVIAPPLDAAHDFPGGHKEINAIGLGQDGRLWTQGPVGGAIRSFDRGTSTYGAALDGSPGAYVREFNTKDPSGRIFASCMGSFAWQSIIKVIAADGTSMAVGNTRDPADGWAPGIALDVQGRPWCTIGVQDPSSAELRRLDTAMTPDPVTFAFAFLERHSAKVGEQLEIDAAGNFWTVYATGTESILACYDAAFQLKFEVAFPNALQFDLALDGQGNAWAAFESMQSIVKVSPSGAILANRRSAGKVNRVYLDADDNVWGYNANIFPAMAFNDGADDEKVIRLAPDGSLLGYYQLGSGADLTGLVVTTDDQLWASTMTKGLLHYTIPPLPSPGP